MHCHTELHQNHNFDQVSTIPDFYLMHSQLADSTVIITNLGVSCAEGLALSVFRFKVAVKLRSFDGGGSYVPYQMIKWCME